MEEVRRGRSVKSDERNNRSITSSAIIGSIKSKLPRNMSEFALNDVNKIQLTQLIFNYVKSDRQMVVQGIF